MRRRTGAHSWALGLAVVVTIVLGLGWTIAVGPAPSTAVSISAEDEDGAPAADPAPEPAPEPDPEPDPEPATSSEPSAEPSAEAAVEESESPQEDPSDESFVDDLADDDLADDELTDDESSEEATVEEITPSPSPTVASNGVTITVNGTVGTKVGDVGISVNGAGAAPAAQYSLWVFSSPQLLTSGQTDAAGSFAASAQLQASLCHTDLAAAQWPRRMPSTLESWRSTTASRLWPLRSGARRGCHTMSQCPIRRYTSYILTGLRRSARTSGDSRCKHR